MKKKRTKKSHDWLINLTFNQGVPVVKIGVILLIKLTVFIAIV